MPRIAHLYKNGNGHLVDWGGINRAALGHLPSLVKTWFPGGVRHGSEFIAFNPNRGDRHLGSFCINLNSGKWADFATGERGGDVVSLAAFRFGVRQVDAAKMLAILVGIDWRRAR